MMEHDTSFKKEWTATQKSPIFWILVFVFRKEATKGYIWYIHLREHTIWFHLYEVSEQGKLIYGDRSHNITTVVTSGIGVELPKGTS